jgi:hypothetical protein
VNGLYERVIRFIEPHSLHRPVALLARSDIFYLEAKNIFVSVILQNACIAAIEGIVGSFKNLVKNVIEAE